MAAETLRFELPKDSLNEIQEIINSIKEGFKEILEPLKEISGILKESFKSLIQQFKEKRLPLNPL